MSIYQCVHNSYRSEDTGSAGSPECCNLLSLNTLRDGAVKKRSEQNTTKILYIGTHIIIETDLLVATYSY